MAVRGGFPVSIIQSAWRRCGGKCECTYTAHGHGPRCGAPLQWHLKNSESPGGWFAVERSFGAAPNLTNCLIFCNECKRKGRAVGF